MKKHPKRYIFNLEAGWKSPQVMIQIRPLMWAISLTFSRSRIGVALGPVVLVLWFRGYPWTRLYTNTWRNDR